MIYSLDNSRYIIIITIDIVVYIMIYIYIYILWYILYISEINI